jgi:L-malate glycosyltransferase
VPDHPDRPILVKVLVVTPWWPRRGDGAGSFVEDQVQAVADRHDVAVLHLTTSRARPALAEERSDAWRVLRSSPPLPSMPGAVALRGVAGVTAALRYLRKRGFDPDIVHAHVFTAGLAALPAARILGVPLVLSEHYSGLALGQVTGRSRRAAAAAYRGADLVCTPSASLRTTVEAIAPGAATRVVPNPVDTGVFSPGIRTAEAMPSAPRVLAVASLVPVKGIATLIDAVELVARKGRELRLSVLGDGPLGDELRRRAEKADVRDRIEFRGHVPRDSVAEAMRAADFMVVPSAWETFSVAAAEALCCGLPVLTTRVGALPELVDESSGRIVEPADPAALAAGLEWMADNAARFDRDAIASRAARVWGADTVGSTWSSIYAELGAATRSLR